MILSHKHEFVFLRNGRTGTTSIQAALGEYHEGGAFEVNVPGLYVGGHVPPAVLRSMLGPAIWEQYFTFCFVRNPWDWFVSQFFWNWTPDPISKRKLFWKPFKTIREYRAKQRRRWYLNNLEVFSIEEIKETYEFLRRYRAVYQADSLFQFHYAFSPSGEKIVDFVGRFENFSRDFQAILDELGLKAELPHLNRTNHRSYQTYYTDETAHLIGELYRIDIETFGYSFGGTSSRLEPM